MLVVITNLKPRSVESLNLAGVTDVYFLVATNDKFEAYWSALKEKCKANFVKVHITFIIPFVDAPKDINNFALAYGIMMGDTNPGLHND